MKQKTAIRQLIELLEKHIDWIEGNHKAEKVDIYDIAAKTKELESVNEQQIIDAYGKGQVSNFSSNSKIAFGTPQDYFNDNFEKPSEI